MKNIRSIGGVIFIILLNMLVVLLIGESLTRIAFHRSMNFDMEMWKYAGQLKRTNPNPKIGHEHRPSVSAYLMGAQVDLNSHGMRGEEVPLKKAAGIFRIVLLGDSLTMGWGVPQKQIYAYLLEKELNNSPPAGFSRGTRFEVLNFGVGNYNTVQEVSLLQLKGMAFKPDLILIGYFINDAEKLEPRKSNFLVTHSFLYAFGKSVINRFFSDNNKDFKSYYRNLYGENQEGWQECQQSLRDLVALSRKYGVPAVMFILPELHDLSNKYPFIDIHLQITKAATSIGLPVIDFFEDFTKYSGHEEEIWVSPTDAHPNALAQPIIAHALYQKVAWKELH
jgi:lysophospholipase L1-like esterase